MSVTIWALIFAVQVWPPVARAQLERNSEIEKLVIQWAPLIWLAPEEKFMPLGVEDFLENVYLAEDNGTPATNALRVEFTTLPDSRLLFLTTRNRLDILKQNNTSFIFGRNPNENIIPVYAVVTQCAASKSLNSLSPRNDTYFASDEPNYYFHVSYWLFFPYNEGKEVCFLGKVPTPTLFGTCLGRLKTMGNHVGDWEHMSLSFRGQPTPSEMYMAVHDYGAYYKYHPEKRIFKYSSHVTKKGIVHNPKFPPIVRMSGGHPVLFSAYGSHGLWSAPGEHFYTRVPQLSDKNGYGVPWKTWDSLRIYHMGVSQLPEWINFKGKWGNPKNHCLLFKKLGICELTDGPTGILMKKQDFYC